MVDVNTMFGLGFLAGLGVLMFIIPVAIYVYTSLAFMAIGKKARYETPGLAWIPAVGPLIIANRIAKMSVWPFLLLIGFFIPFLNILCMIAFGVFSIIWLWKMFEVVKRPGWWAILPIIPFIGGLIFLVLVGITAWGK